MPEKPQSLKVGFLKRWHSVVKVQNWLGARTTENCAASGNRFASDRGGLGFDASSDETEGGDPANPSAVRKKMDDLLCSAWV